MHGLLPLSLRRLREDWARSASTLVSVLLAVSSFVVLTGTTEQARLDARQTIDANFRSSYDILVRPKGSQSWSERTAGRVRPNYLSGLYGGITRAQADQVATLPGVEVSAPIAMVGQAMQNIYYYADITDLVGTRGPAGVRYSTVLHSQRGTGHRPGQAGYVYVSDDVSLRLEGDPPFATKELIGKAAVPVCWDTDPTNAGDSPFTPAQRWSAQCWDRKRGSMGTGWPSAKGRYDLLLNVQVPSLVAAVDPRAEARLAGLDAASTPGALEKLAAPVQSDGLGGAFPVLVASRTSVDETADVSLSVLPPDVIARLRTGLSGDAARTLVSTAHARTTRTLRVSAQDALDERNKDLHSWATNVNAFYRTSGIEYTGAVGSHLTPKVVTNNPVVWRNPLYVNRVFDTVPQAAADTQFRRITPMVPSNTHILFNPVGTFDPGKVSQSSALSKVPLETYQPPEAAPADARTRQLLGGQDLAPDNNPAGYLQQPPLMLMSLDALPTMFSSRNFDPGTIDTAAPISALRVRVADVHGADPESRERVRLVAENISRTTGLDVDITVGSSPTPTRVDLPKTLHGAPAMSISENWVQKGVAAVLVSAVDRKSLVLLVLILAASALAVSITANASVKARRSELGVLSCLGWRPATVLRQVLSELVILGTVAGLLGALIAMPLGAAFDAPVPLWRAALAIPAAILLVVAAGIVPALAASRVTPLRAVRPQVATGRGRKVRLRGPASLAAASLVRSPGRMLSAALALALGLASLTSLLAIVVGFRGEVVGTLLGDAIAVQVRDADIVAGVVLSLIGLAALLDVLFLDLAENAPQYASLQAAGWRDGTVRALLLWQAGLIGACGAVLGLLVGLGLTAYLVPLTAPMIWTAVIIALAGVGATCAVALVPARRLRRLPTARLLSQE